MQLVNFFPSLEGGRLDIWIYLVMLWGMTCQTPPQFLIRPARRALGRAVIQGRSSQELPTEIERIYTKEKAIPVIYGSQSSCEAMKTFFHYNKNSTLLDASKLKRVNSGALEDCRRAMVWSMKLGTTLCIYCGDVLPDFLEKICISKYKDTFPLSLFMYGGMENDMVREKIFRDDEKEAGQCPIRPGFMVCIMIMYDTMGLQMSSMRKEELVGKIPEFGRMQEGQGLMGQGWLQNIFLFQMFVAA